MTTPQSTALTAPSTSTQADGPPAPARSLNRQHVLDEDEYTDALSHIIARDFFPSLVHLDATNDYLDSLGTQDPARIAATVRRLEELATPGAAARARHGPLQTPSQTPYGLGPSDTPRSAAAAAHTPRGADDARPAKRARVDAGLSLDAFQARYTSEDNASFTQILTDENRARRARYGWAWDAQARVEAQRARALEMRERAMIEPPPAAGVRERVLIEAPTPAGLITAAGEGDAEGEAETERGKKAGADEKGKAVVLASRKEDEVVDVMARKKDTRSATVDGWDFKTRNSLMFPPDADVSPYDPQPTPETSGPPKIVTHANTRLPEQDDRPTRATSSAPPSPTRSRIDAAIAGEPYRPRSPAAGGFGFVPALPSPTPSELGPAAVRELMTVGTLLGTPRVLARDGDDAPGAPGTPFRIAGPSAREALSHRLSAQAGRSLRERAGRLAGAPPRRPHGGEMGPPVGTPRRADAPGSLTPAAQRLLSRTTMGTAATRRAEAMGRAAGWEGGTPDKGKDVSRVRWTPTPSPVTRRG